MTISVYLEQEKKQKVLCFESRFGLGTESMAWGVLSMDRVALQPRALLLWKTLKDTDMASSELTFDVAVFSPQTGGRGVSAGGR